MRHQAFLLYYRHISIFVFFHFSCVPCCCHACLNLTRYMCEWRSSAILFHSRLLDDLMILSNGWNENLCFLRESLTSTKNRKDTDLNIDFLYVTDISSAEIDWISLCRCSLSWFTLCTKLGKTTWSLCYVILVLQNQTFNIFAATSRLKVFQKVFTGNRKLDSVRLITAIIYDVTH